MKLILLMKDCLNLMGVNVEPPVKPIDNCSEERLKAIKKEIFIIENIKTNNTSISNDFYRGNA